MSCNEYLEEPDLWEELCQFDHNIPTFYFAQEMTKVPNIPASEAIEQNQVVECNNLDGENWELELQESFTQGMNPDINQDIALDENTHDYLVRCQITEFNSYVKRNEVKPLIIERLKEERKRNRNRMAAIRSRSKKEKLVTDLEVRVKALSNENQNLKETIEKLKRKVEALEAGEVKRKKL